MLDEQDDNIIENKVQQKVQCLYAQLNLGHIRNSYLYNNPIKKKLQKEMIDNHLESLQHKKKKPN